MDNKLNILENIDTKNCKDMQGALPANECLVWYLGHSGWAVQTQRHLLIFDYTRVNQLDEITWVDNYPLDPANFPVDNIYVFASHDHEDHYDPVIYTWLQAGRNVSYILGLQEPNQPEAIFVQGQMDVQVDDLELHTIPATDDGVGFLVKVDGLAILHLGDHANWVDELDAIFKEQIDHLAKKEVALTLAFIPVAKGSGVRNQPITDGARYVIERLKPEIVCPMHGGAREHVYREFAAEVQTELAPRIICATTPGENWHITF